VSELQHPESRGFELVADVYERARPGYPPKAVAWLAEQLDLRAGRTVLDLAAGTGKLTRALLETDAQVIAVEPGDAMRAELLRAVPGVEAVRGSAERIPLGDASVDAVTIATPPDTHAALAIEAGAALVLDKLEMADKADRTGIAVEGI